MKERGLEGILIAALLVWMLVPATAAVAKVVARGLPDAFLVRVTGSPAERESAFEDLMSVGRFQELVSVPKNLLQAYVFGTIDTPTVIEGASGWLFYRDQFEDGKCPPGPDPYVEAANAAATARAMAELVGMRLVWSIAPDKSVVHPEKVGPRAEALAPCNGEAAILFRDIVKQLAPTVVDHLEVLARSKDGPQYYWATDTHWNRVGYLRAVWQLRQALEPGVGPLEIAAGGEWTEKKETDLPRLAVGRHTTEVGPRAPQEIEALVLGTPIGGTEGALVVHDSFLGVYPETFALFGPGARVVNVNRVTSDDLMNVMLPLPRLLVLSSVERLSVRRMSQEWAFDGPLLQPLKEAYLEASRRACSDAQAVTVTEASWPV